ncbi:MAG: hypothetical protein JOY58_11440 [Solirubrobacterales bacterium]|nr:hypothetical protein [Solirubrobacterales bacterium]MBV9048876.1 hypothetical protein [Solirubrobacterales bacterium]
MNQVKARRLTTVAASLTALAAAACGGGSTTTVTKTGTSAASASTGAATAPATTTAAASSTGAQAETSGAPTSQAALPDYKPSSVLSKSPGATVLRSPSGVEAVGAFYKDALAKGGWQIVSASSGPYHASFTAHRSGEGVTVSVYPLASGSGISVTSHRE